MLLEISEKVGLKKFFGILAVSAFSLNWIWEMAQMFAFEIKTEEIRLQVFFFCTLASIIDTLVTIVIFDLLRRTVLKNQALFYLLAAFQGALCALGFEWFALYFELWKYNSLMPMVPIVKVGFLPLTQLTMLVPLAIWLANNLSRPR